MTSLVLGYPNYINTASVLGSGWMGTLPASNVANPEIGKVARSIDTSQSNTKLLIDTGKIVPIRVIALVNHNLSRFSRWRVKLGSSMGVGDILTTPITQVWRMSFEGLLDWDDVSWWPGMVTDEYIRGPYQAIIVLPAVYTARYVTIELLDEDNADGYLQLGRVFVGGGIQPIFNASYGLQDGWKDMSTIEQGVNGVIWANKQRRLRYTSFVLPYLNQAETAYIHELQRKVGITEEVLYAPYPDDPGECQRYGFVGRLSELSPIDFPYPRARSLPVKIEEIA